LSESEWFEGFFPGGGLGGLPMALAFPCFAVGLFVLLVWLFAYGVGLSLFSCRSICTAPVRGGTVVV
jgi:hypothetical protein